MLSKVTKEGDVLFFGCMTFFENRNKIGIKDLNSLAAPTIISGW